ncbi:MAG TPA: hypothetical protein DEP84_17290 [Chloroflexi bacterium]|nr:hypothetical protein [Chloroflexota bacterium]
MRELRILPKILSATVIGITVLTLTLPGVGRAQPPTPAPPTKVTTSTDSALEKIHPDLREVAQKGGDQVLLVQIEAEKGANLGSYVEQAITRPFAPLGEATTFAKVKAGNLTKIAALPTIVRVQPVRLEITHRPPPPREEFPKPSLEERHARLERLRAIDVPWSEALHPTGALEPTSWYDVQKGHATDRAWAKGFRGQGVKVAVLDSGPDLAHPDLQGTWATTTDTESPYYGWPIAFDPYSMLLYVFDQVFGTNYVATGAAFYADTSATPPIFRTFEDRQRGTARLQFAPFAHSEGRGGKQPGSTHEYVFKDTSRSGVYHIGNLPDRYLSELFGEHVAVLVVDEQHSGVYDTVYVDLDNDHDFTDEKPVMRDSPAVYRDMDGDGFADLSGGIVYFIADGETQIPATDWFWGSFAPAPANGSLVAFMGDYDPEIGYHGTLTSSNVVAQGRINGTPPKFRDLPGDGSPNGVVVGAAPEANLVPVGDIYFNFDTSTTDAYILTLLSYDGVPGTGDDIQITSNSYGDSDVDNDGWDYKSRYVDRYVRRLNDTVSFLFSTGNGAPGYGTTSPPSPSVGTAVGASTEFGSTGWDSITDTNQIVWGDTMVWSNRGPGARGTAGVDVVASGAFASGDAALNAVLDGNNAWETWGGTSRSSPVTAGNLALVYQAFKAHHGRWPTYAEARAALKSGAMQTGFDAFTQGAGRVNADISTDIAAGRQGVMAMPDEWRPGDYHGEEYPAFANIIHPNESDTQIFTLHNDSDHDVEVNLTAKVLRRIDSREMSFTSKPVDQESSYNFNAPDYLFPIANVPENADLMVVSLTYPFDQFDPDGNYAQNQLWRLLIYDWTDINGDGNLWTDADGDGIVDHADTGGFEEHGADFTAALDWSRSEIDRYEYIRVMYHRAYANDLQVMMGDPAQRMHAGLFLGLQHTQRSAAIPTTNFQFQIDFYRYENWDWVSFPNNTVTVPANAEASVDATISIPGDTAYGEYQGIIVAEYPGRAPFSVYVPMVARAGSTAALAAHAASQPAQGGGQQWPPRFITIPVIASVAATYDGTGALHFGGPEATNPDATYNNGVVRGDFDWSWRAESGDWRFFFLDLLHAPAEGTKLIIRNRWDGVSPPTDIDTLILGPTSDRFSDPNHPDNSPNNWAEPDYYGPYTLATVGASPNHYLGSGKWRFDTATGGPEEWVVGPAHEGLHVLVQHNVLFSGQQMAVPFSTTLGTLAVQPPALRFTPKISGTKTVSQCQELAVQSSLDLPGLTAEGFGLSVPETLTDQAISQDTPDDPTSASYRRDLTIEHASRLEVRTENPGTSGMDLDLYLLYDANGDGVFSYPGELVASSTTPEAEEMVLIRNPADGDYQIWVHGYAVPDSPNTFTLVIDAIEGHDITVSGVPGGPIEANTPVTLQVCYKKQLSQGDKLKGEVLLGPTVAPGVIIVPVEVNASSQ